MALAKRKHREMLEASSAVAAQISTETAALAATTRTAIKERGSTAEGLCLKQLTALDSLRRLLKPRTRYLGALRATVPTPKVTLDVHVHLETAAEAEAKRVAAQAAAQAAPEAAAAAAGAARGKTPPKGATKAAAAAAAPAPASGKGAAEADDAPEADEWEEEVGFRPTFFVGLGLGLGLGLGVGSGSGLGLGLTVIQRCDAYSENSSEFCERLGMID